MTDDFMALTLDVWSIPPESARRVGHPAPFPVELPEQLIRLYTFEDDLVLDPFMGSGSTLVAAARLGRRYVGYDLDAGYVEIARERVAQALASTTHRRGRTGGPAGRRGADGPEGGRASPWRRRASAIDERDRRVRGTGVSVSFVARTPRARRGSSTSPVRSPGTAAGLSRTDAVWRSLGRACAMRHARAGVPWSS